MNALPSRSLGLEKPSRRLWAWCCALLLSTGCTHGPFAQSLTEAERAQRAQRQPALLLVDPKPYGLTVLPPRDGTADTRLRLVAPGLPFSQGRVELTVWKVDKQGRHTVYSDPITYEPLEETAHLFVDLPSTLGSGIYEVEARLILYGDVSSVEAGSVERVRRQRFTRLVPGDPLPSEEEVEATVDGSSVRQLSIMITGYRRGEWELSPQHRQQLRERLKDVERPDVEVVRVTIEGHTCDLGSRRVNAEVGAARARAAEMEVRRIVPAGTEIIVNNELDSRPLSSAASLEQQRFENRRVVVMLYYRRVEAVKTESTAPQAHPSAIDEPSTKYE